MVNARLKCVTIQLWVWMRQKEFQEFARKSGLTIHSCLPYGHVNTCFLKTILTHTISHTFLSAMQIHPQYDTCIQITWRYAEVGSPPSQQLTSLPQLQGQADPAASSVGIWPGSGVVSKSWDLVVGIMICAFGFVIGQQIQLSGCYLVGEMCCFSLNFWWLIIVQGRRKGSTEFPSHSSMKRPQERKTEPQEVPGLNLTSSLAGVSSSLTCNVVSCK